MSSFDCRGCGNTVSGKLKKGGVYCEKCGKRVVASEWSEYFDHIHRDEKDDYPEEPENDKELE